MPVLRPGPNVMAALEQLVKRHAGSPLGCIKDWSDRSFKFDAISILSILGAGEVDQAVGTLTKRRYTECLPLLAGQVIASNSFTSSLSGFTLYPPDMGMKRMELNESFTRILMSIQTTQASTILTWKPVEHRVKSRAFGMELIPVILSTFVVSPLLVCSILMGDWYGVCNACAIIVPILCRLYLVSQLRASRETNKSNSQGDVVCRSIIMRPDTRMITCIAPYHILYRLFESAEVRRPYVYKMTRRIAWVALGVHLCTLNMCTLFSQIYTIALLGSSTWAINSAWAFDTGHTVVSTKASGDDMERTYRDPYSKNWDLYVTLPPITKKRPGGSPLTLDRRAVAWARLNLSEQEESYLIDWNLIPYRENHSWWRDYNEIKAEFRLQTATSTSI